MEHKGTVVHTFTLSKEAQQAMAAAGLAGELGSIMYHQKRLAKHPEEARAFKTAILRAAKLVELALPEDQLGPDPDAKEEAR